MGVVVGKRFGRLLVLEKASSNKGQSRWKVVCDCGTLREVAGSSLRSHKTTSCGCYAKERKTLANKRRSIHGLANTKEYKKAHEHRRRELKKNLDTEWVPLMQVCLETVQPSCVICGNTKRLETDHVIPLIKGEGLRPGNATRLCKHCNSTKNDISLENLPLGWKEKILTAAEEFRIAWSGGF